MTPRLTALVLAAAMSFGCGGARKESRHGAQANARGERRSESVREGGGERTSRAARSERGAAREKEGGAAREKEPRVPASPEALLGKDTVRNLQQSLAGRGLLREHQKGELDAPTRAAVRQFQEQQGLAATGVPDKETLRKLGVDAEEAYGPNRGGRG